MKIKGISQRALWLSRKACKGAWASLVFSHVNADILRGDDSQYFEEARRYAGLCRSILSVYGGSNVNQ